MPVGFTASFNTHLLKVRLTVTDQKWNKTNHTWAVTAIAEVSYLDEPRPDMPVIFFFEGKEPEEDVGKESRTTDQQGRATRDFVGLAPGKYLFEVFVKDTNRGDRTTKEIRGPEVELSLGEQEADAGKWKLSATAIVKTPTGELMADVPVQFYKNEREDGSSALSDDHGRVPKEFLELTRGTYMFKATIVGATSSARQSKEIKQDRPRKVGKIVLTPQEFGPGEYTITILVLDEDDQPMRGETVFVQDPDIATRDAPLLTLPQPTNENGMAWHQTTVTGRKRKSIMVRVREKSELLPLYN